MKNIKHEILKAFHQQPDQFCRWVVIRCHHRDRLPALLAFAQVSRRYRIAEIAH